MKRPLALLALAAFGLFACGKKDAASNAGAPPPDAVLPAPTAAPEAPPAEAVIPASQAKPLPPPPADVAARAENYVLRTVSGEVDGALTAQLRTFVNQKHRLPESFAEFSSSRLDTIPRPPSGKKWVIDATALQVKAVPSN